MIDILTHCTLCPRNCNINRVAGQLGICRAGKDIKVAKAFLHPWEEPCISGANGSGTVFFSNCSLRCVFCQNHDISQDGFGKEISIDRLAKIFIELQNKGAHNINLVTATHYVPQIIEAIEIARKEGLNLPILYNSSGYENIETIRALEGYIDVYLPDIKYFNSKYSEKYSSAKDYFNIASASVREMVHQVGSPQFGNDGMIRGGVIIRHMMLPGLLFDSKKIMDFIYNEFGNSVYISLMNQYTPMHKSGMYNEINKTVNPGHYDALINYCMDIGLDKGFIQEDGSCTTDFVPKFDLEGI